jgi:hypothetical protein
MQRPLKIGLMVMLLIGAVCGLSLFLDYFQTRSAANLSLTLSRLGPDTPLDSYIAEFGQPMHHFTNVDDMKSWGPETDDALLAKTDLYYFGYWGLPHRYVAVYIDKNTQRSVVVTWKGM